MKKLVVFAGLSLLLAGCQNTEEVKMTDSEQENKENVEMQAYANSYDFGPAIDEIVLTLPDEIQKASLSKETFEVVSKREAVEFSFDSEEPEEKVREEKREVIDVFLSDDNGEKITEEKGKHVTIQLSVSPDNPISTPFNMSVETMMSEKVPVAFSVTQKEHLFNGEDKEISNLAGNITKEEQDKIIYPTSSQFSEMKTIEQNDQEASIQYTDYQPKDDGEKHPLIIWLHGIGEGGLDKDVALNGNKVGSLITDEHQQIFDGAYVLIPQAETFWLDNGSHSLDPEGLDELTGESIYTENLKQVIDSYVAEHPNVDNKKIYIGGCSNGGFMTVNMIANYPDYFAAGFPVCEPYPNDQLTKEQKDSLAYTPLWFVQAETDPLVPAEAFVLPLVKELEELEAEDVYVSLYDKVEDKTGLFFQEDGKTPYEYNGHFSWIDALNNDPVKKVDGEELTLFEWLSNQSK